MRFYQDGSSAVEVMKKIKELRKSHRRGITLDKRQSDYDRSRGRRAFLQEFESSSDEEPELDQTITHPVSGGQGVGLQGPRGSRDRPTRFQGIKG